MHGERRGLWSARQAWEDCPSYEKTNYHSRAPVY
jgi:hypothetical protein